MAKSKHTQVYRRVRFKRDCIHWKNNRCELNKLCSYAITTDMHGNKGNPNDDDYYGFREYCKLYAKEEV